MLYNYVNTDSYYDRVALLYDITLYYVILLSRTVIIRENYVCVCACIEINYAKANFRS